MKLLFSWSTGKDSALALYDCLNDPGQLITGLWTTINDHNDTISFHGVSRHLVKAQAEAIGLPLTLTNLPENCTNTQYEELIKKVLVSVKENGVTGVAFADLFLQDIRDYRVKQVNDIGLKGIFPLWQHSTIRTAHRFLATGFKAVITTVDSTKIDPKWIGRAYDEEFLRDLSANVDPCGENGEFHTFVYAGPIFKYSIPYVITHEVKNGPYITAILTCGLEG
ncbi:diphthine--ammonia ligase [Pseudalkalibacillus hwajinpoensis]|uniref:Dph6-related ATP pyrophosphatase n=1 Tax=Guptibacillus hwajinpoensis TaxID=208199 RepID=UPI00325AC083